MGVDRSSLRPPCRHGILERYEQTFPVPHGTRKAGSGLDARSRLLYSAAWPRLGERGLVRISVPVGAGPDQLVAVLAFDFGEGCVDRSGEARVVQLDREVVAVLLGALLPGRTELDVLRCTA